MPKDNVKPLTEPTRTTTESQEQTAQFYDYTITSCGQVYGKNGTLRKPIVKNCRLEMRFCLPQGKKTYPLARVIYKAFNPDFNIEDINQCITMKDGNKLNVCLNNLVCIFRGDLIQGDKHKSIAKLSESIAEQIKKDYAETLNNRPVNQYDNDKMYNSYRTLAKKYGVTYALIKQVIEGKTRDKSKYKLQK